MYDGLVQRLQQLARRAGLRDVPPAALVAAMAAAGIVVVWALWHWWPQEASGEVAYESGGITTVAASASPTALLSSRTPVAVQAAGVVVHVVGCVRHPGVYDLAAGSRVVDAVDSAGGTLPGSVLTAVNMARVLADGEQVLIPDEDDPQATAAASGAPTAGGAPSGGGAGSQPPAVDLNTADPTALETLPGVGPSTSAKIVADREANGPYASVDDLSRVSGIGPKKLEQLKPFACVR